MSITHSLHSQKLKLGKDSDILGGNNFDLNGFFLIPLLLNFSSIFFSAIALTADVIV